MATNPGTSSKNQPIGPDDARASLGVVAEQRRAAADRLVSPWWYHPTLGLLLAGLLVCICVESTMVKGVGLALYGAGVGVLISAYQKRTGVWPSSWPTGRARRLTVVLALTSMVVFIGAVVAVNLLGVLWPAFVAAALLIAVTMLLGPAIDRAIREQLRNPA